MKLSSRAAVFAAFGVGPLLLAAGCGGSADGVGPEASLVRILPTSFVELPPATTATTAVLPTDADGEIAPGQQQYTIKGGDTLGGIASRYGVSLEQLVGYNEFPNGSNQLIVPGDVIKIPPGASIPGEEPEIATDPGSDTENDAGETPDTGAEADDPKAEGDGDCPTTYPSKAGDNTRIGVAEQFGITFEQMDAANAGTPGYQSFVVGTEITIPCP